jgi:hypothetical protein
MRDPYDLDYCLFDIKTQSEAGHLFTMLADITVDDGANAEFDDLLGCLG